VEGFYDQGIILTNNQPTSQEIYVYPNPASSELSIMHTIPIKYIELRDLSGRLVNKYNTVGESITTIQLSELPAGFYQLGFQLNAEKIWKPLIVK